MTYGNRSPRAAPRRGMRSGLQHLRVHGLRHPHRRLRRLEGPHPAGHRSLPGGQPSGQGGLLCRRREPLSISGRDLRHGPRLRRAAPPRGSRRRLPGDQPCAQAPGIIFRSGEQPNRVHSVFDILQRLRPQWHEEAGPEAIISSEQLRTWFRETPVEVGGDRRRLVRGAVSARRVHQEEYVRSEASNDYSSR